jgi:GAF domain-containing protein
VAEALLGAIALTLLVSPVVYRFAILPLYDQIASMRQLTIRQEQLNNTLEHRLQDRLAALENLEEHANRIQSLSSVARTIGAIQDLNSLLPEITGQVSEQFGFYHTALFLVDDAHENAVLEAANSQGGQRMLKRGHRLKLDATSIVGDAISSGEPRMAVGDGATSESAHFNNPDLPDTRSELGLPLHIGGRVIGALDLQSTQPHAFLEKDVDILTALADQVAIAVENARLLSEARRELRESQITFEKYVRQEWRTFAQQAERSGFFFDGKQILPLESAPEREKLMAALQTSSLRPESSASNLVVPIRLRGQTIGVLEVRSKSGATKWTQHDFTLLEAAADRAALALENARLLQESQRRAAKEAKIGEVTAKIGASINIRNVLQTAVQELGRALPGSEVMIQQITGSGQVEQRVRSC